MDFKTVVFGNIALRQNKCSGCGEYFFVKKKTDAFCSKKCSLKNEGQPEEFFTGVEYRSELPERQWQKRVPKDVREFVYMRDGYECVYCSRYLYEEYVRGDECLTIDHALPRALGGTNEADNLVCCCRSCNSKKGGKSFNTYEEIRNYIRGEDATGVGIL